MALQKIRTVLARFVRSHRAPLLSGCLAVVAVVVVGLSGCGGGDDDGGNPMGPGPSPTPSPSPSPNPAGSMSATIGGQAWVSDAGSTSAEAIPNEPGSFQLEGSQIVLPASQTIVQLILYNIGVPGTYPIGVSPTVFGAVAQVATTGGVWVTPASGNAGTITITTLTATRIAGTFEFTANAAYGGATGTKSVTNGVFDLTYTGTMTPLTPRSGSKVSATLGGTPWNAASVVTTFTSSSNSLALGSNNNEYTLAISMSPVTAPGTYPLGSSSGLHFVTVVHIASGDSWGGVGITGSITITSIDADRVIGTFEGSLPPMSGTAGPNLEVTSGSIDSGFYQ